MAGAGSVGQFSNDTQLTPGGALSAPARASLQSVGLKHWAVLSSVYLYFQWYASRIRVVVCVTRSVFSKCWHPKGSQEGAFSADLWGQLVATFLLMLVARWEGQVIIQDPGLREMEEVGKLRWG